MRQAVLAVIIGLAVAQADESKSRSKRETGKFSFIRREILTNVDRDILTMRWHQKFVLWRHRHI